jgi:hypothetical protein
MNVPNGGHLAHWYIDNRSAGTTEYMSLDLSRHLPRRLTVGPAVIVTDRPTVMHAVIRKRWQRIIREVKRQRASTLNVQKKAGLDYELEHLRACRFTTKSFEEFPTAHVFLVSPRYLERALPPCYPTLYLTTWLSVECLQAAVRNLPLSGLLVTYGDWSPGHAMILRGIFRERLHRYNRQ